MDILRDIGIFAVGSGILAFLIKQLFQININKDLEKYKSQLNVELEKYKFDLNKELEKIKIYENQLHIHKAEIYREFGDFLNKQVLNKDFMSRVQRKDKKALKEIREKFLYFGYSLFFYANDNTILKFVEYRKYGLTLDDGSEEKNQIIVLIGELFVEMRKDLGYIDTKCSLDDFMHILLTDWHIKRNEFITD